MATTTEREEQGSVLGKEAKQNKGSSFAASLAVTDAIVESKATVAEHAVVHGGRTVNVRALGNVESEAEAESGLFADGTAALALALQFSTADILTTLAGTVTADMNTNRRRGLEFQVDPTLNTTNHAMCH